ncbi:MAG: dihydropteroate synthase [Candidatus Margulisbacteria bacterium]|jgi:dihydropteroate synthase|nr:dihydropteroate synthase [Candidatus Margulisiibacteriota bacterium]
MLCPLTISSEQDLQREMLAAGCSAEGARYMRDKLSALALKITGLTGSCALILKEEALSAGAECALPRAVILKPRAKYSALLFGTRQQIKKIQNKIRGQAFSELRALAGELKKFSAEPPPLKTPILLGILNVTPDSFFDGGRHNTPEKAAARGLALLKAGARIIDIGGESTRPGAPEISAAEELRRTIPVIQSLLAKKPRAVISIDTTKKAVARAAVKAGARIINDISGLTREPLLAAVAARYKTDIILQHRSGSSRTMQRKINYPDLLTDILHFLQNSIAAAQNYGVPLKKIIVDPGIGFGKTTAQNLYLLKNLRAFRALGCRVLVGASRKSVIGNTLKRPADQRLAGTIATSIAGYLGGADYLRVHDIRENLDAVKMFNAVCSARILPPRGAGAP